VREISLDKKNSNVSVVHYAEYRTGPIVFIVSDKVDKYEDMPNG
jgi:hypothetical protein